MNKLYDEIIFDNVEGGKAVQILHIGSFDTEPYLFKKPKVLWKNMVF